jgi:hypothetical protein
VNTLRPAVLEHVTGGGDFVDDPVTRWNNLGCAERGDYVRQAANAGTLLAGSTASLAMRKLWTPSFSAWPAIVGWVGAFTGYPGRKAAELHDKTCGK